jgi:imipenem/basic amino acid-specific outer membrane pore
LGANAFAIDNVKVSGDANLFYATDDSTWKDGNGDHGGLFDKDSAAGQASLSIAATADLTEGVSAGTTFNALTTLGLYNNLVGNVWEGTNAQVDETAGNETASNVNGINDSFWFSEAWVAGTLGKDTLKVGRMQIDTPLVFSETWSIAPNTFEAAVLVDQNIPDTTLVGAFIGQANGAQSWAFANPADGDVSTLNVGYAAVLGGMSDTVNSPFHSFYEGAYAIGGVNNSWKPLTVQAWYYDAKRVVQAYWLSADLNINGILAGVQYAGFMPQEQTFGDAKDGDIVAAMVGYEMKDTFMVYGAFSQTNEDKGAGYNLDGYGQSKVYTEMWWNYRNVTANDTTAFKVAAEGYIGDLTLGGQYVSADHGKKSGDVTNTELALYVTAAVGPLDATVAYINQDEDMGGGAADVPAVLANESDLTGITELESAQNIVQVYLTYNF